MTNGSDNQLLVEPVARMIEQFGRLPGVGPKTASRLTFYLLRAAEEQARELAEALLALREGVLPPTAGFRTPDPECDVDPLPSPRHVSVGAALSNSFAFGGLNAVLAFRRA